MVAMLLGLCILARPTARWHLESRHGDRRSHGKALSKGRERNPIRTVRSIGYAFDETFGKPKRNSRRLALAAWSSLAILG